MTHNKQNAKKTWLPLIFATVMISGTVMAESELLGMPPPLDQHEQGVQKISPATLPTQERFTSIITKLANEFPSYSTAKVLVIDATAQKLFLLENGVAAGEWGVSTATKGLGSERGSDQTPLGVHRIAQKIGAGAPFGAIFKARQNTGEKVQILDQPGADSPDDYVTSRIMWLDGLEAGNKTSKERFIYIHGTGEEGRIGTPASHGCIRMRNKDVIELFERVDEDTLVVITQKHEG
jgi:hypothetical protein